MKSLLIGLVLITSTVAAKLPEVEANKLVDAIYKIEGGTKTKHPYGIKSIPIKGNTEAEKLAYARKICWNTVQNTHDRWLKAEKPIPFDIYLRNRYCPIGAKNDPKGLNDNWLKNLRKVMAEKK
jgi:hypothetical protein